MEGLALTLYDRKGQPWAPYLSGAPASIKEDGRPTVVYILSAFDPAGFRIAEKIEAGLREHVPEVQELTARRIAVSYGQVDRKSTRLNSSHANISYAVFCLKTKKTYA